MARLRSDPGRRRPADALEQVAALPRRRQRVLARLGGQLRFFPPADADRHHLDSQPPGRRQAPPDARRRYPRMLDLARGVIRSVYRHPRPYQAAGCGIRRAFDLPRPRRTIHPMVEPKSARRTTNAQPETRGYRALRKDDAHHPAPRLAALPHPDARGIRFASSATPGCARRSRSSPPTTNARATPTRPAMPRCSPNCCGKWKPPSRSRSARTGFVNQRRTGISGLSRVNGRARC